MITFGALHNLKARTLFASTVQPPPMHYRRNVGSGSILNFLERNGICVMLSPILRGVGQIISNSHNQIATRDIVGFWH